MGSLDLYDAAEELLAACEDAVADSYGGPIARSYVCPGPPAWDCEQLVVWVGGPNEADTAPLLPPTQPLHRTANGTLLDLVHMTITVLRCIPVGTDRAPASGASLQAKSKLVLSDVWVIWNTLVTRKGDGTLFPPAKSREFILDPVVALITAGGLAGFEMPLRVQLPGYRTGS